MNLLSGQTVFLTAVVTEPMRYVAVEREALRRLMFEDGDLADVLLSAFVRRRELLQQRQGIGIEIIGSRDAPERGGWPSSPAAPGSRTAGARPRPMRRPRRWSRAWTTTAPPGAPAGRPRAPPAQQRRALARARDRARARTARGGRPGDRRRRAGGPGGRRLRRSEGLDTLVIESTVLGGQAGSSRRIENYLGFPAGISGTELTSRAVTQARKFGPAPRRRTGRPRWSRARTVTW